jgi:ATP-dependent helicase/nuclease subunit A
VTKLLEAGLQDGGARDIARFDLEANVIVEAGAGTGKTSLLVDRILFLLLAGRKGRPVRIAQIVALTFTEKAASEIKLRLAESLDAVCSSAEGAALPEEKARHARSILRELDDRFGRKPGDAALLAQAALRDIDRAEIGTIHSFCSSLLRLYPLEAGLDPEFQVDADGSALSELFEGEWARWLDVELGEKGSRPEPWKALLREASLDDLQALALGLLNPRVDIARALRCPELAVTLREMAGACAGLRDSGEKPKGKILDYLDWMREVFQSSAKALEGGKASKPPHPAAAAPSWPAAWPRESEGEYRRRGAGGHRG